MVEVYRVVLPLWQLPLLVGAPLLVSGMVFAWVRRVLHRRGAGGEDPDWSVPALAGVSGATLFHRWDVRCKILTLLIYSFMIASLSRPQAAMAAIGFSLLALVIARADAVKVGLRLLAISGFVGMFLVVMPVTVPSLSGDTLVVFSGLDWLDFNLRGLWLAVTIAAKAVAITLLMEPLLSTAPLPVTLHGLSRLGAPEMVAQMVLLSHRYLHVFRHEARRMASGMQVRGFRKRTDMNTLRAVANFLGMLFVRSFERTERVMDAMRARGYKGRFPEPARLRLRAADLLLAFLWLAAGTALVCYDRMGG